jgi:hypothetical protein
MAALRGFSFYHKNASLEKLSILTAKFTISDFFKRKVEAVYLKAFGTLVLISVVTQR